MTLVCQKLVEQKQSSDHLSSIKNLEYPYCALTRIAMIKIMKLLSF